MSHIYSRKKQSTTLASAALSQAKLQKLQNAKMSSVSGLSRFASIDPVYCLSDIFRQNFNAIGQENSRKAALNGKNDDESIEGSTNDNQSDGVRKDNKSHDFPEYTHSKKQLDSGNFTERFSSYAFKNGSLANAVITGTTKKIMISCFKRSAHMPHGMNNKQRSIFENNAVTASVDNTSAKLMFNRDAHSAVGIVTDTIKSSMATLDIMKKIVESGGQTTDSPLEIRGVDTLNRLYPFLNTRNDNRLIDNYKTQLKEIENNKNAGNDGRKRVLESALNKAIAVRSRKYTQQRSLMTLLETINKNAVEAVKMFSSDYFAETLAEEALLLNDTPPDDNRNRRRTLEGSDTSTASLESDMAENATDWESGDVNAESESGSETETEHRSGEERGVTEQTTR